MAAVGENGGFLTIDDRPNTSRAVLSSAGDRRTLGIKRDGEYIFGVSFKLCNRLAGRCIEVNGIARCCCNPSSAVNGVDGVGGISGVSGVGTNSNAGKGLIRQGGEGAIGIVPQADCIVGAGTGEG